MVLVGHGLAAGQTIVSAGVHTLTSGQKVTLYRTTAASAASASAAAR
jgi:membrane fusion protein, multidrug efflux system